MQKWHRLSARSIRRRDMTKHLAQCRFPCWQDGTAHRTIPHPGLHHPGSRKRVLLLWYTYVHRGRPRAFGTWNQWQPHRYSSLCLEKRIAGYDLSHLLGFASFIAAEAARGLWLLKIGAMATAHVGQIHASVTSRVKLTKQVFQKLSGGRRVEI